MEQSWETLANQQVDPEVFRRVWSRVMPDQRDSPLVVVQQEEDIKKAVEVGCLAGKHERKRGDPGLNEEMETLKKMMALLWEGMVRLQMLNRKSGGQSRQIQAMAADNRRAMRQLETSLVLLTGQRERNRNKWTVPEEPMALGLRSQFLWEQRWRTLCRKTGEETEDIVLARLCKRLEEESILHSQLIRQTLEMGRY